MWSVAPIEISHDLSVSLRICAWIFLFIFLACKSGNSYYFSVVIASKMAITGSIDSSDRALQASSGNLGEILRTGAGIPKRSQSLLQQKNIQAVDKESPVGHKPLRPIQQRRHTKRASGQPATTYRCEFNSPRYVEYREKQKKQKNGKGRPQPWPDHVEEAFHDGKLEHHSSSNPP